MTRRGKKRKALVRVKITVWDCVSIRPSLISDLVDALPIHWSLFVLQCYCWGLAGPGRRRPLQRGKGKSSDIACPLWGGVSSWGMTIRRHSGRRAPSTMEALCGMNSSAISHSTLLLSAQHIIFRHKQLSFSWAPSTHVYVIANSYSLMKCNFYF